MNRFRQYFTKKGRLLFVADLNLKKKEYLLFTWPIDSCALLSYFSSWLLCSYEYYYF